MRFLTLLIALCVLAEVAVARVPKADLSVVGHAYYDYFSESYQEVERIEVFPAGLEGREETGYNWCGEKTFEVRLENVKPLNEYQVTVFWEDGRTHFQEVVTSRYDRTVHIYEP